jgi:hypothetical protein
MAKTSEIIQACPRISKESVEKLYTIRQDQLNERKRYDPTWADIAEKLNPAMSDWNTEAPAKTGPRSFQNIYDNTGIKASVRLSDGIQGYAFSRGAPWMRLILEDEELMDRQEVAEWLQRVEGNMYHRLNLSSFYDEGRGFVRTGADFGTAVMFRQDDPVRGVPHYHTLHLKRVLLMENPWGEADTLFRDLWLRPYEAAALFGIDALPQKIREDYEQGKTGSWLFQQFILPLDKFDLDIGARETRGMPYYSLYVAESDHDQPIREGGYSTKCFFAWRWSRNPDGDVWGSDCPGMIEISNVKQANGMRKDFSRLVQNAARTPLKATEGLRGKINLTPNGITYVGPGQDFAPALTVGKIETLAEDLKMMQDSINQTYYANLFLVLTENLERIKTATEVEGIKSEQAAMLTAFFGRLSVEFLEPAVEDLFRLELETGRVPPPPPALRGQQLQVDLISPLAQLQKRYLRLDTTKQWLQELLVIAGIQNKLGQSSTVLDNVDFNEYARVTEEMYHVDKRVVRDIVEVQRMRAARAQLEAKVMQHKMQVESAKAGAQAFQAAAESPQPGSLAEAVVPPRAGGEAE